MRKLALSLLLLATPVFPQPTDCNSIVVDNAQVLSGGLADPIAGLIKTGADVRVLTDNTTMTTQQYKDRLVSGCASWQGNGGHMKGNLIVFVVFPNAKRMGLFYGEEWGPALDNSANLIKSQFMGPAFHSSDYERGFENGILQVTNKISSFQTGLRGNVVIKPPTDYTGLWKVLAWLLILAVLAVVIWALIRWRYHFLARKDAQRDAIETRNQVARSLRAMDSRLSTREALGEDVSGERAVYGAAMEDFSTASGNQRTNPEVDGLSVEGYNSIQSEYSRILRGISWPPQRTSVSSVPEPTHRHKRHSGGDTNVTQTASPAPVAGTTVIYSDPGYVPIPIFIEENNYVEPAYAAPEPAPSESFWGGSSDRDGSGGGGSDSSYDGGFDGGGSDSSFDSGGSDSGGGSDSSF